MDPIKIDSINRIVELTTWLINIFVRTKETFERINERRYFFFFFLDMVLKKRKKKQKYRETEKNLTRKIALEM